MAYRHPLPPGLAPWRVKIYERERLEPPHATVLNGTSRYRWNLRDRVFMDTDPPAHGVPAAVVAVLEAGHAVLIVEWNVRHPDQSGVRVSW